MRDSQAKYKLQKLTQKKQKSKMQELPWMKLP